MRVLLGVESMVVIVGMLWANVTPAEGCSCGPVEAEEALEHSDFVVVGELTAFRIAKEPRFVRAEELSSGKVNPFEPYFDGEGVVRVDRYLKGGGPTNLRFGDDTGCAYDLSELIGSWHLIFLNEDEERLVANTCVGTIPLDLVHEVTARQALHELESVTGQGSLPSWEGEYSGKSRDFPWAAAAAAAVLGPLAFLAGAALLWRRGG